MRDERDERSAGSGGIPSQRAAAGPCRSVDGQQPARGTTPRGAGPRHGALGRRRRHHHDDDDDCPTTVALAAAETGSPSSPDVAHRHAPRPPLMSPGRSPLDGGRASWRCPGVLTTLETTVLLRCCCSTDEESSVRFSFLTTAAQMPLHVDGRPNLIALETVPSPTRTTRETKARKQNSASFQIPSVRACSRQRVSLSAASNASAGCITKYYGDDFC